MGVTSTWLLGNPMGTEEIMGERFREDLPWGTERNWQRRQEKQPEARESEECTGSWKLDQKHF